MKKAKKTVRKVESFVLIGVYMIMLIICAYLNSYNIKLDTSTVINIVMFILFLYGILKNHLILLIKSNRTWNGKRKI